MNPEFKPETTSRKRPRPHSLESIRRGAENRREIFHQRRMDKAVSTLGENPAQTLNHLLNEQHISRSELAGRLNLSLKTTDKLIKEFGVTIEKFNRRPEVRYDIDEESFQKIVELVASAQQTGAYEKLTDQERAVLTTLYLSGYAMPKSEAARLLNLSRERVRVLNNKAISKLELPEGSEPKGQGRPKAEPFLSNSDINALKQVSHLSYTRIGEILHEDPQKVRRIFERHNIPHKGRKRS